MKTRISKWKEYRQSILENRNIEISIINSDPELKKLLEKANYKYDFQSNQKEKYKFNVNGSYKDNEDLKKIDNLLLEIEKNENMKPKESNDINFNSHKYDLKILQYFDEFDNTDFSDTDTTDLKIKKFSVPNIEKKS